MTYSFKKLPGPWSFKLPLKWLWEQYLTFSETVEGCDGREGETGRNKGTRNSSGLWPWEGTICLQSMAKHLPPFSTCYESYLEVLFGRDYFASSRVLFESFKYSGKSLWLNCFAGWNLMWMQTSGSSGTRRWPQCDVSHTQDMMGRYPRPLVKL